MNIRFTRYSKIYYAFAAILIIGSIVSLFVFGLKFGIEFTGGSSLEMKFKETVPASEEVLNSLSSFNLGEILMQKVGSDSMIIKFRGVTQEEHAQIVAKINELSPSEEKSFLFIGPSIGQELRNKTLLAIALALVAITIYIALAFRRVSRPVSSWKYGITSLIALFHDVLVPLGVFALLGKFYGVEITVPIIAALLTILGFSVHDTIVIFDRIRENILRRGASSFEDTVNWSLNQTIGRSLSTVFTVLLVLLALFFYGGETLKYFALALIVGITSGAYSSIFIASPLLVSWLKRQEKAR